MVPAVLNFKQYNFTNSMRNKVVPKMSQQFDLKTEESVQSHVYQNNFIYIVNKNKKTKQAKETNEEKRIFEENLTEQKMSFANLLCVILTYLMKLKPT